jgi:hypothetical protein
MAVTVSHKGRSSEISKNQYGPTELGPGARVGLQNLPNTPIIFRGECWTNPSLLDGTTGTIIRREQSMWIVELDNELTVSTTSSASPHKPRVTFAPNRIQNSQKRHPPQTSPLLLASTIKRACSHLLGPAAGIPRSEPQPSDSPPCPSRRRPAPIAPARRPPSPRTSRASSIASQRAPPSPPRSFQQRRTVPRTPAAPWPAPIAPAAAGRAAGARRLERGPPARRRPPRRGAGGAGRGAAAGGGAGGPAGRRRRDGAPPPRAPRRQWGRQHQQREVFTAASGGRPAEPRPATRCPRRRGWPEPRTA